MHSHALSTRDASKKNVCSKCAFFFLLFLDIKTIRNSYKLSTRIGEKEEHQSGRFSFVCWGAPFSFVKNCVAFDLIRIVRGIELMGEDVTL